MQTTTYREIKSNEIFTVTAIVNSLLELTNEKNQVVYVTEVELDEQFNKAVSTDDPYAVNFYK